MRRGSHQAGAGEVRPARTYGGWTPILAERENSPTCDLPPGTVDSRCRIAELSAHGSLCELGPEGVLVVRRLIASLVLAACLLGIVQPVLACAGCAPRTDCPAGCTPGCGIPASPCAQAISCCEVGTAVAPSISAIAARTTQSHTPGSSVASSPPTDLRVAQSLQERRTPLALVPDPINESHTYLRTARLRL
jgi:hypothetical protein